MRNWILATCIAALAVGSVASAQSQPNRRYTVPELVKEMSPAVVSIESLDPRGRPISSGSGAILQNDGLIVTSAHLLEKATSARIKTHDGEIYDKVEILDYDLRRDVLVLKIRPFRPLPVLQLAPDENLTIGEDVAAIGNPEGLEASVSAGIVSGRRQANGYQLIQTTAPVSPGSSGGPLFNMQGQVIGITTAQLRTDGAQNLNFAVPILYLRPLISSQEKAISVSDFAQRAGSFASSGTGSSAPTGTTQYMSWRVVHDHNGKNFSVTCVGTLTIYQGGDGIPWEIGFSSQTAPADDWRLVVGALQEAAKNSSYGKDRYAFRLRFVKLGTHNFYAIDESGSPTGPSLILGAISRVFEENRKPR